MRKSSGSGRGKSWARLLAGTFLVAITISASSSLFGQTKAPEDPETKKMRQDALTLYRQGKFVDAMPLLEKLSAKSPDDFVVKEHWAYCVLEYSKTLTQAEDRKKARLQARQLGLEAKKAGDEGELLQVLLSIPEDGSDLKFSDRPEVDEAMKSAEASRARGHLDEARQGYQRVLELDPKNYDATVFIGDVYFSEKAYNAAGEWFAKAIQINPDKETAYRYWADALAAAGKNEAAREKYINAVVAEPYIRQPWTALRQWADRVQQPFNAILLQNKSASGAPTEKTVDLNEHSLKGQDPEADAWAAYNKTRQAWKQEKFKKEFPQEASYRHTLKEESEALDALVAVVTPDSVSLKKAENLDPALLALVRVDHEGLLDAYVLLNRADRDIAQDYPAYRSAHRDKLYRYMDEFVLAKPTK
jgi:tetratricopeptide (TPR) repeat protein